MLRLDGRAGTCTGVEGSIRGPHGPKNHCRFLFKRKAGRGVGIGTDFQPNVYANNALES